MKLLAKTLIITAAATMVACNNIAEDERLIPVESVEAERAVLIEDFTGQNCLNCPDAHKTIEALEEQYGDKVIAVSIHAGAFGIAADNTRYTGLMQPEGDTYNNMWGIDSWPAGVVNRTGGVTTHDQWPTAVRTALAQPTPLDIDIDVECSETELVIHVECAQNQDVSGNLQVWIVESGIVARQRMPDGSTNREYVHNNVYRASVNGVGGVPVNLKAFEHQTFTYTQPLRATATETWVPENLAVVAFVYNSTGVVQAERESVKD